MPRIRPDRPARRLVALVIWAISMLPGWAFAQPARPAQPLNPKELTLSPAPAPVPALKYRLLPSWADLNPGDAAPIYLRIRNFEESKKPGEGIEPSWNQISDELEEVDERPARTVPGRRCPQVRQPLEPSARADRFRRAPEDLRLELHAARTAARPHRRRAVGRDGHAAMGPAAGDQGARWRSPKENTTRRSTPSRPAWPSPAISRRAVPDQRPGRHRRGLHHARRGRGADRPARRAQPLLGPDRAARAL